MRRLSELLAVLAGAAGGYALVVRGALTLDLGIGRRVRPLGPTVRTIAAPRETVFDVVAAPYLGRTPRALGDKLRVLERASDMVLADHRTTAGRLTTTTCETVRFERPHRVSFRLVRGPVPHVVETYELHDDSAGTRLVYAGELGHRSVGARQLVGRPCGAGVGARGRGLPRRDRRRGRAACRPGTGERSSAVTASWGSGRRDAARRDRPAAGATDSVRCLRVGGRGVAAADERPFGVGITDGIGSTEMLHILCSNRPGDALRDLGAQRPPA